MVNNKIPTAYFGQNTTNAYALLTLSDFYDFSRCSVRCACFKGTDKAVFLDKLDCSGAIFEQVEQAISFVLKNLKVGIKFVGLQGIDDFEIPVNALREAIVNAVVHRNYMIEEPTQIAIYDDRVEIISPGRLVSGLSLESALNGKSVSRNPIIAKVFRMMKLMEEWGSGFRRINQECEKANLNLPKFQENELDCSIVFERGSNRDCQEVGDKSATKQNFGDKSAINEKSDNVLATSTKDKIIEYLKTHDNSKSQEIADYIGLKISRTKDYLSLLAEEGIIEAIGGNKNRTYVLKVDR